MMCGIEGGRFATRFRDERLEGIVNRTRWEMGVSHTHKAHASLAQSMSYGTSTEDGSAAEQSRPEHELELEHRSGRAWMASTCRQPLSLCTRGSFAARQRSYPCTRFRCMRMLAWPQRRGRYMRVRRELTPGRL